MHEATGVLLRSSKDVIFERPDYAASSISTTKIDSLDDQTKAAAARDEARSLDSGG